MKRVKRIKAKDLLGPLLFHLAVTAVIFVLWATVWGRGHDLSDVPPFMLVYAAGPLVMLAGFAVNRLLTRDRSRSDEGEEGRPRN